MNDDRGLDITETQQDSADAEHFDTGLLLAQADIGSGQGDGLPGAPTPPEISEVVPDGDNRVRLAETASIEDIRLDGDDLLLVQADGSQIRVVGGALNVPTFLIGEIEIAREVLVSALDSNGLNVAAGPGNTFLVSSREPAGSGGDFGESSGASISDDQGPVLALLGNSPDGNDEPPAAGETIIDDGQNADGTGADPVVPDNVGPTGTDKTVTIAEDTSRAFSASDFGFADADAGDSLSAVRIDTVPGAGTSQLNGIAVTAGQVIGVADLGNLVFTPAADANGAAYAGFTFSVQDSAGAFDATPNTISFDVTPVNDAPVAVDDVFSGDEDTEITGNVLSGNGVDTDIDGDSLSIVAGTFATAEGGSVTIDADGGFTYTPVANFNGADSFTYTLTDGTLTDTGTVNLSVGAQDDPPVAVADSFTIAEDSGATTLDVLANDTDVDGGPKLIQSVSQPANGTVVITNGGADLSFTPDADFNTEDAADQSFTYTLNDGSTATVTVTVTPVNDAPVAADDIFAGDEDAQIAGNVLADNGAGPDADIDGDALTVSLATDVSNGTLVLNANGSFTYTPDANFNGADSFTYTVNDGTVDGTTATVTLTVGAVNDAPEGADATITLGEDGAYSFAAQDFGFSDPDAGDSLSAVRIDTLPGAGTLQLNGTDVVAGDAIAVADLGNLVFTPAADANGAAYAGFTFSVQDSAGAFDTTPNTISIDVTPVNDVPVAADDIFAGDEDTQIAGNVLADNGAGADADIDGDALNVSLASDVSNGTLVLNANGSFTYTPDPDFNGADSFTYTVNDGTVDGTTATVTLTVGAVNDAPETAAAAGNGSEDAASIAVALSGSDPDGSVASFRILGLPANGTLYSDAALSNPIAASDTVAATGNVASVYFVPDADYSGTPSFTYAAIDDLGQQDSTPATATITVSPVDDAPVANADSFTVAEDSGATVLDVLANDTDIDAGPKLIQSVSQPANGTVVITNGGADLSFTPDADFNTDDAADQSFTYTLNDGSTATVTVTVTPVNDAPVAADDIFAGDEDAQIVGNVLADNGSGPDADIDGDALTVSLATDVSNGTLVLNANGSFTYTPDPDFNGADSFSYTVNDGTVDGTTATVTLNVGAVNDAPVANADSYSTTEDTPLTIPAPGVLLNDTDVDGDPLTSAIVTGPTNGSLTLNADGSFTYTPDANFSGADSFTYTVNDGTVDGNTATVNLTVGAVNDAPETAPAAGNGSEDAASIAVALSGSDPDGSVASFRILGLPANGTLYSDAALSNPIAASGTVAATGNAASVYFVPDADYNGTPSFTYAAIGDLGQQDATPATASITVTPVDDAPVAVADSFTVAEDSGATTLDVLANDTDVDAGPKLIQSVSQPANGTVVITNGGADLSFTPDADFNTDGAADQSFTYTLNDGSTATVTVTVTPVNDAPVAADDIFAGDEDAQIAGNVLADNGAGADADIDGDALTVSLASDVSNGTLVLNANGSFTYTPDPDFNGSDSFTYTVNDGTVDGTTATVTLTVGAVNDAPETAPAAGNGSEDAASIAVALSGSDPDGSVASFRILGLPSNGTLYSDAALTSQVAVNDTVAATGNAASVYFVPDADYNGTPSFTYAAIDDLGQQDSTPATATINVTPVDDAPVAVADSFTVTEDSGATVLDVLANDTDIDAGPKLIQSVSQPANGTVVITNGGADLSFTPDADFNTDDAADQSFTYTLNDGSTATVTVTVTPVNDAPVAADDTFSGNEDAQIAGNVLADNGSGPDADIDGDTLTVSLASDVSNGTLVLNANGSFTYTPDPDFNGTDSFTYTVNDGTVDGTTATVTLTVGAVNDAPVTNADSYSATEDTPLAVDANLGVLANDTDAENDPLTAVLVTGPGNGSLALNADGSFTYTPDADFSGTDSFTYKANDGTADGNTETVTINVAPVADGAIISTSAVSSASPTPLSGDVVVNTTTTGVQYRSSVASIGNGFVVTWIDDNGSPDHAFFQRYSSDGTPQGVETEVDPASSNSHTMAVVAEMSGGYVIAWIGDGIQSQRYASDGTPIGSVAQVSTDTTHFKHGIAVSAIDSGYVVTWRSDGQDGFGGGIYAQRFDDNGLPQGGETLVNTTTASSQVEPVVAQIDGGYVIVWSSAGQSGGDFYDVYMQRYSSAGVPQGGEVRVNSFVTGLQTRADVVAIEGGYVVVWADDGQDGSGFGVYSQRFDNNGNAQGGETRVNTETQNDQIDASVAAFDGGYVVVWTSRNQDGDGYGRFAQRFANDGSPIGGEFQLNADGAGDQRTNYTQHNVVAVTSDGVLVTVWKDGVERFFDSTGEIEHRIFQLTTPPVTDEDTALGLSGFSIALSDTDGSETITSIVLDGFPAGATFSVGAAGTGDDAGKWVISSPADIDAFANGTATMTPPADYNGTFTLSIAANVTDSATYADTTTASDSTSTTTTVDITVTPVNDAPEGADKTIAINEDGAHGFSAADFGFSDVDAGDSLAAVRIDTLPGAGSLQLNGNPVSAAQVIAAADLGNLVFTPDANGASYAGFTFSVQDSAGAFDATPNTISIDVTPVNDAPVAVADSGYDVDEDVSFSNDTASGNVLTNDSDPDSGDHLNVVGVSAGLVASGAAFSGDTLIAGTYGYLSISDDGEFRYTLDDFDPDTDGLRGGQAATDVFTYTIEDDGGLQATATLTIDITGANDRPFMPGSFGVTAPIAELADASAQDIAPVAGQIDVIDNDLGDPLGLQITGVPALAWSGGALSAAQLTDLTAALVSGRLTFSTGIVSNGGTQTLGYTWDPAAADLDFLGGGEALTVTFAVAVGDGSFLGLSQPLTFTVNGANDAPVISSGATGSEAENTAAGNVVYQITASDADAGDTITYGLSGADAGLFDVSAAGEVTFKLSPDFEAPADTGGDNVYDIVVHANDGTAGTTRAVAITVTDVFENTAPTTDDILAGGDEDTAVTVLLTGSDPDGNLDGFVLKSLPANGTLYLDAGFSNAASLNTPITGTSPLTLYFKPDADWSGSTSFTYVAHDETGSEDATPATATIDVAPVADTPVLEIVGSGAGKLFFSATDGTSGYELWSYDGTNPPEMVHDINPGSGGSDAARYGGLIEFGGKLYFSATDGANGLELWSYDGTSPPTMVADINMGGDSQAGYYGSLVEFAGKLYFSATDGSNGLELWSYDGANPPMMVADIKPDSGNSYAGYYGSLVEFDGKLYFCATDGSNGHELWSYDGTNPPTMVADIVTGFGRSNAGYHDSLIEFGGKLYFSADTGANGKELWSYDGTNPPTMVADINPGSGDAYAGYYGGLIEFGGKLYFSADDGSTGVELWSYDGTNPPAVVADLNSGNSSSYAGYHGGLIAFGGKLYFSADDGVNGYELWSFDGTNPPAMVADINPGSGGSDAARYGGLFEFGGKLYFSATDGTKGYELWSYDGVNPPAMVADIVPGSGSSGAGSGDRASPSDTAFAALDGGAGLSGDEDTAIDVPVTAQLADTDGSESFVLVLTGFPAGAIFNAGALDEASDSPTLGAWVITQAQFEALGGSPLTVTPLPNWNGTFTLSVEMIVTDSATLSTGAVTDTTSTTTTVDITVNPVNDAPVTNADSYATSEDTPLVISGPGVLANDTDVENGLLTAALVTGPDNGSLTLNADGSFTYTPDADFSGADSFTYKTNDGTVDGNTETVTIDVNPVNDAPVTNADSYSTSEDAPLVIGGPGVLANDTDAENDPLTAAIVTGPANGSLALNADGSFTYTPDADFSGTDSFTYKINDGTVDGNTETVTIDVAPVADGATISTAAVSAAAPTPLTGDVVVNTSTTGSQHQPSVGAVGDGYVVAWVDGSSGTNKVYFQRFSGDGTPQGGETAVEAGGGAGQHQGGASVAEISGGFVVAWEAYGDIHAQRYSYSGTPVGGIALVNTDATHAQSLTSVSAIDGGYVVTWRSHLQDGDAGGIYAQRFDDNGNKLGSETQVNTGTVNHQNHPAVAQIDGGYVIVWESFGQTGGADYDIYFQRYNSAGVAQGGETRVNTYVTSIQERPDVAAIDGGYVVVWSSSGQDGDRDGVYSQRFDNNGNPLGSETRVNTETVLDQKDVSVAAFDGGYIVVWTSSGQDGSGTGRFAQRFADDGSPIGSEFQLNADATGFQGLSFLSQEGVAVTSGGAIVTVWEQDSGNGEVEHRLFQLPSGTAADEDATLTLSAITVALADGDGSETITSIVLDGFPAGATFSVGAAGTGVNAGKWVIGSAADIAAFSNGTATMTPAADYNGTFTLSVTANVTDSATLSSGAVTDTISTTTTVDITVNPVNDAPVVSGIDAGTVSEDDAVQTIDLLAGQTDVDGDTLSATGISVVDDNNDPVAFTDNGDGTISIDPDQFGDALENGQSRTVTVSYGVSDSTATIANTATLVVTGADDNSAPTTDEILAGGDEDAVVTLSLTGSDPDGNLDGFVLKSLPANGTLYLDAALSNAASLDTPITGTSPLTLYFKPDADWSGTTGFTYAAHDDTGTEDATPATATIDVAPVADTPSLGIVGSGAGKLFFSATNGSNGYELWSYDGTNPPEMVHDIIPGSFSSGAGYYSSLIEFGGKLYFSASDGSTGLELWSYDGTNPPMIVADINPGSSGSGAGLYGSLIEFGGKLYFSASDGSTGLELWSYDGANSPMMVADINTGGDSSAGFWGGLIEFGGKLYFSATDGSNGPELWSYDGVNAPVMVADINPGSDGSGAGFYGSLIEFGGKLYFSAYGGSNGLELWSYDGASPPTMVADINPGSGSSDAGFYGGLIEFGGKLYFSATDGTRGYELWSYDGANPPAMVADINPGVAGSEAGRYGGLFEFGGKLYFSATDGSNGYELWSYDGVNPPAMVADINPGSAGSDAGASGHTWPGTAFAALSGGVSGDEDTAIEVPVTAQLADTDDSESFVLVLTGFPAGAVFNAGALDEASGSPTLGAWVITQAQFEALSGSPLTVTPLPNWNGQFDLSVEMVVTDTAQINGSDVSDTTSATQQITITVNPVNEAPEITSGNGDTASYQVAEGGVVVADIDATDVDGDTLTYAITGGDDGALFDIDANNGELIFKSAPDAANPQGAGGDNVYDVEIAVSDGNGGTDSQAVSVSVLDVPVLTVAHPSTPVFTAGDDPLAVIDHVSIESSAQIALATVQLDSRHAEDLLAIDATVLLNAGLTANYDVPSATLTISGNADVATYEAVFLEILYSSLSTDPSYDDTDTQRAFYVQVTTVDGVTSNIVLEGVNTNAVPELDGLDNATFSAADATSAPQIIDADVSFDDKGREGMNEGSVTVSGLIANEDVIAIPHQGLNPGEFALDGTDILYGGTLIGAYSGGNGQDFVVSFSRGVTPEIVEALIENLTYFNEATYQTETRTLTITVEDAFGATVSKTFDVTLTDVDEIPAAEPVIELFSLPAGDGSAGFVLTGIDADDDSGYSVSSAGDVNGDGFGDILIGAYGANQAGAINAGETYVVFGSDQGFSASIDLSTLDGSNGFVLTGIDYYDQSGIAVSSAGDVNGDGIDDILIGASRADLTVNSSEGETYVVFGKSQGFAARFDLATLDGTNGFVLTGIDNSDLSGNAVSSAGDVNGDGFGDLLIGAYFADRPGADLAGESYVVFGSGQGFAASLSLGALDGSNGFVLTGIDASDYSGYAVSSAGDVNGDGFDDILIGAFGANKTGAVGAGESYVVFGKSQGFAASFDLAGLNGSNGFVLTGIDASDYSGHSVSSAGDVNGDGFDDILIGASNADLGSTNSSEGETYVVFGKSQGFAASFDLAGLNGSNGFVLTGIDAGDISGHAISSAGDFNGDGFDDILIGAYKADQTGANDAGESYVLFGKSHGFAASYDLSALDGTSGVVFPGIDELDRSGYSVSSAGDVNGDGFDDILIGAYNANQTGANGAGESYVVFGGAFGASVTPVTTTGTAGAEILIGGIGNDILTGNGGADVIRSGAGDDYLHISDASFFKIDGGHGTDTLTLDGSGITLDLTQIANNKIESIERIDLTGSGDNTLILTLQDLLGLSNDVSGGIITLTVDGDAGDRVKLADFGDWAQQAGTNVGGVDYAVYTNGTGRLLVQDTISVTVAGDPIILDLDGDGLRFAAASFDINNDGHPDSIGWPGAGDGLLVADLDGSGVIEDGSEVFSPQFDGGGFATSIEALASWDSNEDGKISALDAGFGTIRVWVDANADGVSDAGELQSLSGLGIVSIGLGITETDYSIDGQHVFAEGLFEMSDGSSRGYFGLDLGPVEISGSRTVTGGEGDDILAAILGHDTLTGGAGADTFVFDETALGDAGVGIRDLIADYSAEEGDMIDLSALLDGAPVDAGNASDYVQLNGAFLEVDIDGSGGAAGFVEVAEFATAPGMDALRILVDHQPDPATVWI